MGAWEDATPPAELHLECGAVVPHAIGTRVFNHYDGKPGVIVQLATYGQPPTMPVHQKDGGVAWWVRVRHDDGSTALLDQSRLCSIQHAMTRGWIKEEAGTHASDDEPAQPLWDRATVNRLKAKALVRERFVVLQKGASPADSLQAAIELGYPHFSHLNHDYPVYAKEPREI